MDKWLLGKGGDGFLCCPLQHASKCVHTQVCQGHRVHGKNAQYTAPYHTRLHHTTPHHASSALKPSQPTCIAPNLFFSFSFFLSYSRTFFISLSSSLPLSPPLSLSLYLSHSYSLSSTLSLSSLLLSYLQLTDALVLANDHIFITGSITPKYPTGRYTYITRYRCIHD